MGKIPGQSMDAEYGVPALIGLPVDGFERTELGILFGNYFSRFRYRHLNYVCRLLCIKYVSNTKFSKFPVSWNILIKISLTNEKTNTLEIT